MQLSVEPVAVAEVLAEALDLMRPLAADRAMQLQVDARVEKELYVLADRQRLKQVLLNLLTNGVKYTAVGGCVAVSVQRSGPTTTRIVVNDNGPGIAPEHLPRLTERFYRVDVGDSRSQGGTGLGLSLVKHILNRHRGRLLIESVPKHGATFTACFPQPKTLVFA